MDNPMTRISYLFCIIDKLLVKQNMFFVGPPLNIKEGDGM